MPHKISPNRRSSLHLFLLEISIGLILSFSSLAFFIKVARDVMEKEFQFFDIYIEKIIYASRSQTVTSFMINLTQLGSTPLIFIGLVLTLLLILRHHKKEAFLFIITLAFSGLLNLLLKQVFHLPRPNLSPLVIEGSYSFPSGHATNSLVFYSLLTYLVFRLTRNKSFTLVSLVVALSLILLIGYSRIYLGVHHPTDVLAGFVAGFWCLITAVLIEKSLSYHRLFKQN